MGFCGKLLSLVCLATLCGCITHQYEMGQRLDPGKVEQILEGKTTEVEVFSLLGQPQRIKESPDGSKILIYSHYHTQIYGRPNLNDAKGGTTSEMIVLGIRNGLVIKKWQSSSNLPMKMSTGKTFSVPDQFK